jgi:hypothetical protein
MEFRKEELRLAARARSPLVSEEIMLAYSVLWWIDLKGSMDFSLMVHLWLELWQAFRLGG